MNLDDQASIGLLRDMTKMKSWKFRDTDVCPLYNEKEDNFQVLRCNSDGAKGRWASSIDALENSILDSNTPTNIVETIVS